MAENMENNPYDDLRKAREMLTHNLHSDALFLARQALENFKTSDIQSDKELANALIYEIQGKALLLEKNYSRASSYLGQALIIYSRHSKMQNANEAAYGQVQALWALSQQEVKRKEFEKGAYYLNQASLSLSQAGFTLYSAEMKACSFAVRAEGTDINREKIKLLEKSLQALQYLVRIEPIVQGHYSYFNALLHRHININQALTYAIEAYDHYKMTDRNDWTERAINLVNEISAEIE